MRYSIQRKEYSPGEILLKAWKHWTGSISSILLIILIVYVPLNIVVALVPFEPFFAGIGLSFVGKILAWLSRSIDRIIGIVATMAIIYLVSQRESRARVSISDCLKRSLKRWPHMIATSLIYSVFLIGLFILLIVPGIVYAVYWFFIIHVVILKGKWGLDALRYSRQIIKGRWWTVLGYVLVFAVLSFLAQAVLAVPFLFSENIIVMIAGDTISDFVASFFVVVGTVFFLNFDRTMVTATA
ncbi:hypothetical protein GF351_02030 [Candidatus Woesearchaeota archaeon]|nr:hypothetical protein [Candidatus Woesearchaeota archaeon]